MSTMLPLDQGNCWSIFVLHPNSAEPIGRFASHSQYIYLQISTGTLLLCLYRDCLRSSFFLVSYRKPSRWTQLFIMIEQIQRTPCLRNKSSFVIEPSVSLMISWFFLVAGVFLDLAISSSPSSESISFFLVRLCEFISSRRLGMTLSRN